MNEKTIRPTRREFLGGQKTSDIINPHDQTRLCDEAACVVIAATATEAEVYSTALLCMGKELAEKFCAENSPPHIHVLWAERRPCLQPAFVTLKPKAGSKPALQIT